MHYYIQSLKKYFDFTGRARRKEFWIFMFVNLVIFFIIAYLVNYLPLTATIFALAFFIFLFIPTASISVRRLHDLDRSGWWVLILLIPLLNMLFIVFALCEGVSGANKYGEDPLVEAGELEN